MRNLLTEVSKMKNIMGLTEADKPKYSPEVKSLVAVLKDNKVYSAQIQKFINKIEEYSKDGLVDFGLITRGILKTLKLKGNKDINVFEFFKQLTKSLEKRKNKKEVVNPEEEPSILDKDIYKKEIFFLQVELLKLQEWLKQTGKTVIIVFEGRDSAGKGSTIKKFTENLNPRYYKVIALGIPTPDERKNWWDRYSNQIEKGKINFFDRSWYNRGLVEPVMGYGSSEEYEDFMDNVQDFEESLVVDGDYLFKLWFSIDKETQAKRFDFRQKSPLKYWKYSENDEKMQDVWEKFTEYKQKLFDKTSTVNHPWVVLDSNDKKISGLNSIRYVLQNIPYTNKDEDILNKDFPEAMTVLKPNINEQSFFDDVNKIAGLKPNQNSDNFWGDVNKLTGISDKSQSGVVNAVKDGAKKIAKITKEKSSNSNTAGVGTVSDKLVDFVGNIEFFVPCVYDDAKGGKCIRGESDCCLKGRTASGTPTIGYGTVYYPDGRKVTPKDPSITKDKAKVYLKTTLNKLASKLLSIYPNLNQKQVDALSSLCYQVGFAGCTTKAPKLSSSLKINPNSNSVKVNFLDFSHPDRREKEWKIYSQGIYS
jgi:polyphosphate kinase 2